jgi:DNA cross-link repair 1C protein
MPTTVLVLSCEQSYSGVLFPTYHNVRYLIEGAQGSVLHTGDFRAEPWFLQSLARNPFLQPYLAPGTSHQGNLNDEKLLVSKTLETIYFDSACVFSPISAPTKVFLSLV